MLPSVREIKNLRKKAGLTQKELANLTGLSQSYIARLERGDLNPTYENVKKIFSILENEITKVEGTTLKANDIMSKNVISVQTTDTLEKVMKLLLDYGFSQLPVIDNGVLVGSITDSRIGQNIANGKAISDLKKMFVLDVMEEPFPQISESTPIKVVSYLLKQYQALLVVNKGKITGIITKSDLLKSL
ncbi:MAG: CBS domain-containing protein [Thermoplasmata archaeon]